MNPFDPDDPSTWTRYSETKDDGGKVVLVRYPEGYRLRFDGVTVWREDATNALYTNSWGIQPEAVNEVGGHRWVRFLDQPSDMQPDASVEEPGPSPRYR